MDIKVSLGSSNKRELSPWLDQDKNNPCLA